MSDAKQFHIRINGVDFDQRLSLDLQKALQVAHGGTVSYCLCQSTPIRLVVKRYTNGARTPVYGLARWPETGYDHHHQCHFFGDDSCDTNSAQTLPALEEQEHGVTRAYLETSLKIFDRSVKAGAATKREKTGVAQKREKVSDLALLMKLWRSAGLNISRPKGRSWFHVTFNFLKAASKIIINSEGETLDQYLLLAASDTDRLVNAHNAQVLERTRAKRSRLFVIGTFKSYTREKYRQMLRLYGQASLPLIAVNLDQIDAFQQNFFDQSPSECKGCNIVAFACIEPGKTEWWSTVQMTGFVAGTQYLPVKSLSELRFETYLHAQERKFIRPIYANYNESANKPQYILLDTAPRTYCQIVDNDNAETNELVRNSQNIYQSKNQVFICWKSWQSIPFPSLPISNC